MQNLYKLTSQVSLAPDPQLSSMLENFKRVGDAPSFSVVFNEVQRRKEVRDAAQSKMMGGPKSQVADQLIQESKMAQMPAQPQGMGMGMPQGMPPGGGMPPQGMPPGGGMPQGMPPQGMPQGGPPQGLPEQAGIGQLPAPNMQNMAGGGIVSFAGDDDSYVPFDSALEGPPDFSLDSNYSGERDYLGLDYNPPDVTAPETTTNREEDEEDPYPRFDIRDAVGGYGAEMDKVLAEQQANYDKYKAERDKFGSAYANAEARDKEMSQQYEDEARTQRGMPWLAAGAAMMGSSERGLGGLAEAIKAGLPAYTAGRDKLAGLKDKQRDFMQTVAEARRAEARGDTDKLYALQQSMAAQKANIAGVKAELGLKQDEIGATLAASTAKSGDRTPAKEAGLYYARARMLRDAAEDPENAAQKAALLAKADEYTGIGDSIQFAGSYGGTPTGVNEAQFAAFIKNNGEKINNIAVQLTNPKSTDAVRQQALQRLKILAQQSPNYDAFMARFLPEEAGGVGGGANAPQVGNWEDAPDDE